MYKEIWVVNMRFEECKYKLSKCCALFAILPNKKLSVCMQ